MSPSALAAGNFNPDFTPPDFHLDLIVADRASGTARWLQGRGTGAFNLRSPISVGADPSAVAVSDFDGDGSLDFVTANAGDGTVTLVFGRSNGFFDAKAPDPVGPEPRALAAIGRVLVVAAAASGNVSVFRVEANRNLRFVQEIPVGGRPVALAAGDVNGDGLIDLAVASQASNSVTILRATGVETFTPSLTLATGREPSGVALGDLNRNGTLDLVVAETGDNSVAVWQGNGVGGFVGRQTFGVGLRPVRVVVVDDDIDVVNGDQLPDILVLNSGSNDVWTLEGQRNGTFSVGARLLVGRMPMDFVVGNFDNDPARGIDMAIASMGSGEVTVIRGQGGGSFVAAVNYVADNRPIGVTTGDFDQDGFADALVANGASNNLSLLRGNGRGAFRPPINISLGASPTGVISLDVDGNGMPDAAVTTRDGSAFLLLRGVDGGLAAPLPIPVGGRIDALVPVDLNDDGRSGVVAVRSAERLVTVLMASGNEFGQPLDLAVAGRPLAATSGHFTPDGRRDIAVALTDPMRLQIFPGAADGTFGNAIITELFQEPTAIVTADFDGDRHDDIAVLSAPAGAVSILLGLGDGRFRVGAELLVPPGSHVLMTDDLNADGHADLLVLTQDRDELTIFGGMGNGSFDGGQRVPVGAGPVAIATADLFVNNRLPDVLVVNQNGNNVTVLRNITPNNLPPLPTNTVGPGTPTPRSPGSSPVPTPTRSTGPRSGVETDQGGGGSGLSCQLKRSSEAASGACWSVLLGLLLLRVLRGRRCPKGVEPPVVGPDVDRSVRSDCR